jgi:hypothetical protein
MDVIHAASDNQRVPASRLASFTFPYGVEEARSW